MIVYKIYTNEKFEEIYANYFNQLLDIARNNNYLSSTIDEIIITDDILGEIERYTKDKECESHLTQNREYFAVAKTITFEDKVKIFFDVTNINIKYLSQIFLEQIIGVYANDIISSKFNISHQYSSSTPLIEVIKIFFSQWATHVVASILKKRSNLPKEFIHSDVKIYVDAFKRNIRKHHFQYQHDVSVKEFWLKIIKEADGFIRMCLNVWYDEGDISLLQEFSEVIPNLILEIEKQTINLMDEQDIDFAPLKQHVLQLLKLCSIEIINENSLQIKVMETPKKLFKGNIVDTEQRIVAFIDILGFSEIIREYDSDEHSNILNELHDALETAVKVSIEEMIDPKLKNDLNEYLDYRMFSDCICLSLPYIEHSNDFHIQFYLLSTIAITYQFEMLKKGFFVRGGVSMGSFFANKNMIFSGGLVNAYKLEQAAGFPVLNVDEKILNKLNSNFPENTKGLFYDERLVSYNIDPKLIFLNPFYLLDNSKVYIDHLQSVITDFINEEKEDTVLGDALEKVWSFSQPTFEKAKAAINPEVTNAIKLEALEKVEYQLKKNKELLANLSPEKSEPIKEIIKKHEFFKNFIEWSLRKTDIELFNYYKFIK